MLPEDEPDPAPEEFRDNEIVLQAVQGLPDEYRAVISLKYYDGLDVKEIAGILDAPVATIKTWLSRARGQLRRRLQASFGTSA
jgi:RNA polymerase sigma-70 factor (ECF subfamily)